MKKADVIAMVAATAVAVAGLGGCASAPAERYPGTISGEVRPAAGVVLPPNPLIFVALVDGPPHAPREPRVTVDPAGVTRVVIDAIGAPFLTTGAASTERQPFLIRFNPREIRNGRRVEVRAWAIYDGKVRYDSAPAAAPGDGAAEEGLELRLKPRR